MNKNAVGERPGGRVLFVLACAMGVGPLIIYGLSAVSTVVIDDLEITAGQFGWLATACFLSATVASAGLGKFTDLIGPRTLLLAVFGGAAVALALAGLSKGYLWLLLAVIVSGAAQAISNPVTNRVISEFVPLNKQSSWIGIKQSGVQGSQFIAGLLFPALAVWSGWRGASGISAVLALALMALSWWLVPMGRPSSREPNRKIKTDKRSRRASPRSATEGVLRLRFSGNLSLYAFYAFLSGAALQATNVYLPLFAQRDVGFSLILGGMTVAVAGGVGVTSRIVWGSVISSRKSSTTLLSILAIGAAAGSVSLLLAGAFHVDALVWFGVFLHGSMALAVNVVLMIAVMRDANPNEVGAASGTVALGMYLGFALGPLAMGTLLEAGFGFTAGWACAGAAYLFCLLVVLRTRR